MRQAEHAGLGVARLRFGRDGAHFDKAKAHGTQTIDAAGVFVQTCGQAHAVGEVQARQCDGLRHKGLAVNAVERGVLGACQALDGQFVGFFGVHLEQKRAGEGVGDQGHWIIPASKGCDNNGVDCRKPGAAFLFYPDPTP
jgi:hypothetical protein